MPHHSSRQDSWSSLLSELGVDDPVQHGKVSEPELGSTPEPKTIDVVAETETSVAEAEHSSSGKGSRFGLGIMSDSPSHSGGTAKKPSFFDRFASINLFGVGAPEKINPKVMTPTAPETSSLSEEALPPKKLQKVEETPKEPKPKNSPQIGAVDPWSSIATQIGGVQGAKAASETSHHAERREEPQVAPEPVDDVLDIESMVSFRDLRKKKKFGHLVSTESDEHVSEPKQSHVAVESPRKDRSEERDHRDRDSRDHRRGPREERKSDKYSSFDKRKRRHERSDWKNDRDTMPEESNVRSGFEKPMDLDDNDIVPSRKEGRHSFAHDNMEDEEMTASPKRNSRNRQSRPRRHEKTGREPRRTYGDTENGFDGGAEEDYEVLTPTPEREYGPPRDVFADLFTEDGDSRQSHESRPGHLARGSKARGYTDPSSGPYQEESAGSAEESEESDPFAHFNKRGGRGSRAPQSRRGNRTDRHVEQAAATEPERGRGTSFDEEETSYSRSRSDSSSRRHGGRGRVKDRVVEDEPMDEQSLQEEQEMMQLHRNIPGWSDAILPIIESNISRHASRPNTRKGKPERK